MTIADASAHLTVLISLLPALLVPVVMSDPARSLARI